MGNWNDLRQFLLLQPSLSYLTYLPSSTASLTVDTRYYRRDKIKWAWCTLSETSGLRCIKGVISFRPVMFWNSWEYCRYCISRSPPQQIQHLAPVSRLLPIKTCISRSPHPSTNPSPSTISMLPVTRSLSLGYSLKSAFQGYKPKPA